jgi:hypothetical protein
MRNLGQREVRSPFRLRGLVASRSDAEPVERLAQEGGNLVVGHAGDFGG